MSKLLGLMAILFTLAFCEISMADEPYRCTWKTLRGGEDYYTTIATFNWDGVSLHPWEWRLVNGERYQIGFNWLPGAWGFRLMKTMPSGDPGQTTNVELAFGVSAIHPWYLLYWAEPRVGGLSMLFECVRPN